MTPDVRLIMPCTQLNLSNSRLKVPFVKSAHILAWFWERESTTFRRLNLICTIPSKLLLINVYSSSSFDIINYTRNIIDLALQMCLSIVILISIFQTLLKEQNI